MYKSYSELGVKPEQNTDQYSVVELKSQEERLQLVRNTKIVCIDIYADWCGPCIQTAPAYSVLATKYNKPNICSLVKLNWNNVGMEERNEINGIPVFLFYLDGEVVNKVVGADLADVENKLKELLNTLSPNSDTNKGPQASRNTIRSNKQQGGSPSFEDDPFTQYAIQQESYRPQGGPQGGPQGHMTNQGQQMQRNNQTPQAPYGGQMRGGPVGPQGPQGMPQAPYGGQMRGGPVGPQGPQGMNNQGMQGMNNQGMQGMNNQGMQGMNNQVPYGGQMRGGPVGPQGPQGPQGPPGPQGPVGPQGQGGMNNQQQRGPVTQQNVQYYQ
jgi:thiol-disulfide isomerase/thioredoxin